MKNETTPDKISNIILEFCNKISTDNIPEYVIVNPQKDCTISNCFPNVAKIVRDKGGEAVNGWAIWKWANILIEAEAHSVWKRLEGSLVDVTPHNYNEKEILFLSDPKMVYKDCPIPSIRLALTSSPLVSRLIYLFNERDKILSSGGMIPPEMVYEINHIQYVIHQDVKGNEFCPCQSGLKYKKCCGQ